MGWQELDQAAYICQVLIQTLHWSFDLCDACIHMLWKAALYLPGALQVALLYEM